MQCCVVLRQLEGYSVKYLLISSWILHPCSTSSFNSSQLSCKNEKLQYFVSTWKVPVRTVMSRANQFFFWFYISWFYMHNLRFINKSNHARQEMQQPESCVAVSAWEFMVSVYFSRVQLLNTSFGFGRNNKWEHEIIYVT